MLEIELGRSAVLAPALVERNNGIYGGCWCIAFHSAHQRGVSDPRTLKERLVRESGAHAALVFDQARAALEGALAQIASAGGGVVEAISEVTVGREAQGRFLFSATVELFEQLRLVRGRRVGKHARIVSREIAAALP